MSATVPFWPRGLREPLAAAYVGLSESTFRTELRAGHLPKPVRLTAGRQVWLREDLDAYLDRLAGHAPASVGVTIEDERAMLNDFPTASVPFTDRCGNSFWLTSDGRLVVNGVVDPPKWLR